MRDRWHNAGRRFWTHWFFNQCMGWSGERCRALLQLSAFRSWLTIDWGGRLALQVHAPPQTKYERTDSLLMAGCAAGGLVYLVGLQSAHPAAVRASCCSVSRPLSRPQPPNARTKDRRTVQAQPAARRCASSPNTPSAAAGRCRRRHPTATHHHLHFPRPASWSASVRCWAQMPRHAARGGRWRRR